MQHCECKTFKFHTHVLKQKRTIRKYLTKLFEVIDMWPWTKDPFVLCVRMRERFWQVSFTILVRIAMLCDGLCWVTMISFRISIETIYRHNTLWTTRLSTGHNTWGPLTLASDTTLGLV